MYHMRLLCVDRGLHALRAAALVTQTGPARTAMPLLLLETIPPGKGQEWDADGQKVKAIKLSL
jgi:hypothetical protein